ncbi:hypothetical protein COL154_013717 [Colletotrichum chrysophilum]|uniref:uncharacterized protein n=1 Tax=Colletotrichum chrysophilum TaxID=1836956 RepID=UPI0023014057|nr:uncharacterized protein COL26b_013386 [Colletotrichum chrysophilum]KAJ0335474.1 hypothetical protein KNSL1_013587 [Colletotrichum chrysophilum]KAJ0348757.1 hypothetical protein COL154_013717 [Colletotrichum chrysophilum]KAJ0362309.1 hypothetical protein COL26b_013386 [Colletotrichum chrysophilum]
MATLLASVWAAALEPGLHASGVSFLAPVEERDSNANEDQKLWKGKGGGSGGGGGGGRGGGSSGHSSSGGRSSGTSGTGGIARGGSRDSSGGSTKTGSGPAPAYGGSYGGGAKVPDVAGASRGPGSIAPFLLIGGGLAFWPGLWLGGAYMYPYSHPYRFYNQSARENQTKPYMSALLGNGSYQGLNQSVVTKGIYNNTDIILINGTLPNGTTASGGTDDVGSAAFRAASEALGFWSMLAVVLATVFAA